MKKWNFKINGTNIGVDLFNYDSISFKIVRDKKYWGYMRQSSVGTLVFLKSDAEAVKGYFDLGGVNGDYTFTIEKLNVEMQCYETFQEGVIDFFDYKEEYNEDNRLIKVEVGFVDSSAQQKLRTREKLDLRIGRAVSVENDAISTINPVDVLYLSRPIKRQVEATIEAPFRGIFNGVSANEMKHSSCEITGVSANMDFFNNSVSEGPLDISNLSNSNTLAGFEDMSFFSLFLTETSQDESFTLNYDIDATISTLSAGTGTVTFNNLRFRIYEVDYNGVEFSNPNPIHTNTFSVSVTLNIAGGSGTTNISDSITFTKNAQKVYFCSIDALGQNWALGFSGSIDGTIDFEYDDIVDDSEHSSFMIFECFQSLLEQITDQTDILYSDLLGRTDLGYASNGDASEIAVTNGLFLRNAVFSDDSEVSLELAFEDLYKTLDAIYGIAMWYDGEKINIERRSDAFGSNIVTLTPQQITKRLFTDLLYTDIEVGNKRVPYENVNGTNEYNTVLKFSTPLRVKQSKLDLVTKYNTDYLGIELARRLTFETDQNVDTKYDEKVFLSRVEWTGSQWQTVIGLNGGYTSISGVPLTDYSGNLDFSPKRMLLNNSDLLSYAMWKNTSDSVRFEKSENLAALSTRKTGETADVVELDDLDYSDMTESLFIPMLWEFEVGERDLWEILTSQQSVFQFTLGCETIEGYLWEADTKNDAGTIKLIEKR